MAELAAALRAPSLDEGAYATAEALVAEIGGGRGAARSPLYTAANVKKLNETSRGLMMRDARRALMFAQLASAVAPRVKCRTTVAAGEIQRLTAEALYLCACGYLRCRRCYEAKEAAERAMRAYRDTGSADDVRKELAIVEMFYGQIVFYRGNTERGLRIIARAAHVLLHVCKDKRLYAIAVTFYAMQLLVQRKFRLCLRALDEAMFYALEIDDKVIIASILHNVSGAAAELGLTGALPCRNISRERFEELRLDSEVPKSRYITYSLLKRAGKHNEAVSELYMIRQEFLDRGLPVVAAQTVVQIVEQLILLGRYSEARYVGEEGLQILTEAGVEFDAARLRVLLRKTKLRRGR